MLDSYLQVKYSKNDGVHPVHNCVQSIVAYPHSYTGHLSTTEPRYEDIVSKSAREVLSNRQLCDAPHKKSIRISLCKPRRDHTHYIHASVVQAMGALK